MVKLRNLRNFLWFFTKFYVKLRNLTIFSQIIISSSGTLILLIDNLKRIICYNLFDEKVLRLKLKNAQGFFFTFCAFAQLRLRCEEGLLSLCVVVRTLATYICLYHRTFVGSYYRIPKHFFGIRLKCIGFTEKLFFRLSIPNNFFGNLCRYRNANRNRVFTWWRVRFK